MPVCEVHKDGPIICGCGMFALAHVVAEGAVHELSQGRYFLGGESFRAEQAIDGAGSLQYLKLAARVGPLVALRRGEQDRPGRAQGHETILVEGQPLGRIVELQIGRAHV